MTIKTLTYIHDLLQDKAQETQEVYRAARKLEHEYADNNADHELIKRQREAADELHRVHLAAWTALQDFETQEW